MEQRLIDEADVQKLLKERNDFLKGQIDLYTNRKKVTKDAYSYAMYCELEIDENLRTIQDIRDKVPTVEAEVVKHGKWLHGQVAEIVMQDATISSVTYLNWNCSECGYTLDGGDFASVLYHYCPNCGAKMESEEEE